jgi:curli biogenesis system outer membrane secretion channel CsgG
MKNRVAAAIAAALFGLGAGNALAQSQTAAGTLEKCDETLGTLAVVEDRNANWYHTMQQYKIQSTVPLLRMLIQQSNCFVVVERGQAMNVMRQERELDRSGESREGSDFGKGQMVAADYAMNPSITFSARDTGGVGGALGNLGSRLGSWGSAAGSAVGAIAGGVKFREASTMLTLIDNRSGVQLAAAEGSSSKADFGAWGGVFTSMGGQTMGGYTNTPEGKVIAASFADAYNNLVRSAKNYKAQEVKGGLGTGGRLGVQGGRTPASKGIGQ